MEVTIPGNKLAMMQTNVNKLATEEHYKMQTKVCMWKNFSKKELSLCKSHFHSVDEPKKAL